MSISVVDYTHFCSIDYAHICSIDYAHICSIDYTYICSIDYSYICSIDYAHICSMPEVPEQDWEECGSMVGCEPTLFVKPKSLPPSECTGL